MNNAPKTTPFTVQDASNQMLDLANKVRTLSVTGAYHRVLPEPALSHLLAAYESLLTAHNELTKATPTSPTE